MSPNDDMKPGERAVAGGFDSLPPFVPLTPHLDPPPEKRGRSALVGSLSLAAAIFFAAVAFALRFNGFSTRAAFAIFIPAFYFIGRTIALWGKNFGYWLSAGCLAFGMVAILSTFVTEHLPAFINELEQDNDFIMIGIGGIAAGIALAVTTQYVHSDS